MYIVVVSFILFFVGCGANMNSFNINVEGTVDYTNNPNNNNTNSNTGTNNNTNTNTGTNNNTNTGTNNNTNTNTGTNNNTNSNTNNNTNVNLTDNLGTQLGSQTAIEVAAGSGIPVTGADPITIQVYTDYLTFTYPKPLAKVKHSQDVASILTEGLVNGSMARIPRVSTGNTFVRPYFTEDGDSTSKVYEIPVYSRTLPDN